MHIQSTPKNQSAAKSQNLCDEVLAAGEEPKDTIAAQIRAQGFACDKPRSAVRDAKKSKPDEAVWVLKCNNAAYRIRLNPDMAAKVERLQ